MGAEKFLSLAKIHKKRGNYKKAIRCYWKAFSFQSNDPNILQEIGHLSLKIEEYEEATKCYKAAIFFYIAKSKKTLPYVPMTMAFIGLARATRSLGFYRQSLDYCLIASRSYRKHLEREKKDPITVSIKIEMAKTFKEQGKIKRALEFYSIAFKDYKDIVNVDQNISLTEEIWFLLAIGKCLVGEYREAIADCLSALRIEYVLHKASFAPLNKWCDEAHKAASTIKKDAHPTIALSLYKLGKTFHHLKAEKKAISLYEQAAHLFRRLYGDHFLFLTSILNSQSEALETRKEYVTALKAREEILFLYEYHYGDNHPSIAAILNKLGETYGHLGDIEKGIHLQSRALQLYKSTCGEDHPGVAMTLHHLGKSFYKLGNKKKAISLYREALYIYRMYYLQYESSIFDVLRSLGDVFLDFGRPRRTIWLYEIIVKTYSHSPCFFSDKSAVDQNKLGGLYYKLGEREKAASLYVKALNHHQTLYYKKFPGEADVLLNLSLVHLDLGDKDQALSLQIEALTIYRAHYGSCHLKVAETLTLLGRTFLELEAPEKALSLHKKALQIHQTLYKKNVLPERAAALDALAQSLCALGKPKEAIRRQNEARLLYKKHYGEVLTIEVATIWTHIGETLHLLGKRKRVIKYLRKALVAYKRSYVENHPERQKAEALLQKIHLSAFRQ